MWHSRHALCHVYFTGAITLQDSFLLRCGKNGSGGFDLIGSKFEKPPLVLRNYMSYDDMQIAALIGLSGPTRFINSGSRYSTCV
jgi:hypothetical protein